MLSTETAPKNVVVLRLVGTLTAEDVAAMKRQIDERLTECESIGLVVDVSQWGDITAKAIAADAKFEWEMLGKLKRIPRVAFITDKQWYNLLLKVLNPILPSTEVKVFSPGSADAMQQATEFAADVSKQSIADVSRSSIEQIPTDRDDLMAFVYRGHLESEDLDVIMEPMKAAMQRNQKVDLFVRLENFTGFDPSIILRGSMLSLKMAAIKQIRRYAIVGANPWMQKMIRVFDPMVSIEMRTFDVEQESEAWKWLNS